jgi:hypothetical protein
MKKALLVSSMIPMTVGAVAQSTPAPSPTFMGIQLDKPLRASVETPCPQFVLTLEHPPVICREVVAGVETGVVWRPLNRGEGPINVKQDEVGVLFAYMKFSADKFDMMRSALTEKYGNPVRRVDLPMENSFGATSTDHIYTFKSGQLTVRLESVSTTDIDEGQIMAFSNAGEARMKSKEDADKKKAIGEF